MKKTLSSILLIAFLLSLCNMAYAVDTTQIEMEQNKEQITIPQLIAEIKQVADVADGNADYSVLIPAAELFYEEVLPTLSTDDIIHIIEDPQQSMAYRFMVIDTYSLAAQESRARSIDSAEVDEALSALINPDSGLSIMAMSSLSNPTAVVEDQLKTLIEDGSDGEQVISLKLLCNQYANDAYTVVNQILQNQAEETALYDAAVNFLPRLIGEANSLTAENVVSIIEGILQDTQSESLKITCVQALMEVGTPSAANAVYELREVLPIELVNYFNKNARVSNDMLEAYVEDELSIARSATNRLGNALYRDGVGSFGINVDWHAGLVAHASGPMYNSGAWVIHHPGGNAVVRYDTFATFLSGNSDMGEHYKSSVSQSTAYNIFYTAHDLTNEGIAYTFSPMLRTSKSAGKINPSDITKIRCDGVVEYCYEYNGVRLQGPVDSANTWDISTVSGAEYHPATYRPSAQSQCFDREVSH